MDRLALRTRAKARFKDTANAIYSDTEWNDYLNEALTEVLDSSPWWPFFNARATVVMAPAATGFNLTTDVPDAARISFVYNETDQFMLHPYENFAGAPWGDWPEIATSRGTPERYSLEGSTVLVWPRPQAATTLTVGYVSAGSNDLTLDTSEPPFPERFHRMLIDGALSRAYVDDGNMEQSAAHQSRFDKLLAAMQHELLTTRTDRYPALVDDFFGRDT